MFTEHRSLPPYVSETSPFLVVWRPLRSLSRVRDIFREELVLGRQEIFLWGKRWMALFVAAALALWPVTGLAHDASSWGGLFRSRDGGTTWFQASVGKVMGSALAVAVDLNDPTRLLLGTDSGLLESRNGGLDWDLAAADVLVGAVLAVAFDGAGQTILAASGSTLAIADDGVRWRSSPLPVGAAPARSLVAGAAPGVFYLVGWQGL